MGDAGVDRRGEAFSFILFCVQRLPLRRLSALMPASGGSTSRRFRPRAGVVALRQTFVRAQWAFVLEHLSKIAEAHPAAGGRAADEMLGVALGRIWLTALVIAVNSSQAERPMTVLQPTY